MRKFKNIYITILSVLIIFSCIFQCTFVSYASSEHGGGGSDHSAALTDEDKKALRQDFLNDAMDGFVRYGSYILSLIGALSSGDFSEFLSSYETYKYYVMNDWQDIEISDDGEITIPEDLIAIIKQALKEYSEETCGYKIVSTTSIKNINPSSFYDRYGYSTVNALADKYGYIGVRRGKYSTYGEGYFLADMSGFLNGDEGLYLYSNSSSWYYCYALNYESWEKTKITVYYINNSDLDGSILETWDEVEEFCSDNNNSFKFTSNLTSFGYYIYKDATFPTCPGAVLSVSIISKDGRRVLVFNSNEALINYTVDHRAVYFGSQFYEDTGSVTGTYDDLQDWLDGKYDDFWEKMKDLIPDGTNLTEDELEDLVDQLLGKLGDVADSITDSIDEGTEQTNSLLQQILSALNALDATVASAFSGMGSSIDTSGIEAYLAAMLADLDYIAYKFDDLTMDEAEEKTDSLLADLTSSFSEISSVASTKFPLSLPWDIYNILLLLGGSSASSEAYDYSEAVYSVSEGIVLYDSDGEAYSISDFSASYDSSVSDDSEHGGGGAHRGDNVPYFELPFVLESWGISEKITVDLSDFEIISQLCRSLFTFLFGYALINLTFKVVDFGKDIFL